MYTDHTSQQNSTLYTLDWLEPEITPTASWKFVSSYAHSYVCLIYTVYIRVLLVWGGEKQAPCSCTPYSHRT